MEYKVSRLYLVIKWLVDTDATSNWNYSSDGEADDLYFYGKDLALAPSQLPVEVARIMVQDNWKYLWDEANEEHTYVFPL